MRDLRTTDSAVTSSSRRCASANPLASRLLGLPGVVAAACTIAALSQVVAEASAYYVDVPFWDEWLLLPLLKLDAEGGLGWVHLLAPHNEHRPVVSRLVLIALARLTNWNLWHECLVVIGLGVATIVPFWVALWRGDRLSIAARTILLVVAGVTFLSMNQWENWLWGWQVKVMLTTAAATWGSLFMTSATPGVVSVGASAACGVIATFSFGNGFLLWPAMAPAAWHLGRRRPALAVAWLVVAVASIAVFFLGLGQPLELNRAMGSATLTRVIQSSGRVMGSALTGTAESWLPTGLGLTGLLAGVVAAVASLRAPANDRVTDAATVLVAFGGATAILIAVGRQVGPAELIPARYMAFMNLFWIALAILLVKQAPRAAGLALTIPVLAVISGVQGREAYVGRHESLMKWRASLYAPVGNPIVDRFFWAPGFVTPWLSDLRGLSFSLYDCTTQLPADDFDVASDIVASHGRSDDVVITSSDWAAACLRGRLASRRSRVTVVSASESAAAVATALAGRTSAFLVSGGDVVGADARRVVEGSGFPVYRSPVGSLRLFYFPGRVEYVRDRLLPDEVSTDYGAFQALGDVAHSRDERFLLRGWLRWKDDADPDRRVMVTRHATLYVPVPRNAPAHVELRVSQVARALTPLLSISVNGVAVSTAPLRAGEALELDLADAAWRYGSNIVDLELGRPTDDLSGLVDDTPLATFDRIRFRARPGDLH